MSLIRYGKRCVCQQQMPSTRQPHNSPQCLNSQVSGGCITQHQQPVRPLTVLRFLHSAATC